MAENSKIEWTDSTFNPWVGCTKVSPGCDHCYAETQMVRRKFVEWGPNAERRRTSEGNWKQPHKWNRDAAMTGVRRRVFCSSLADVFDNAVPDAWRDDLWALIGATPFLDWLLLTKRPQNISKMLPRLTDVLPRPWPNVWLGTTVENQAEADRRIPHLLAVPAAKRFLSCEPLLGPVDLTGIGLDVCCGDTVITTDRVHACCARPGGVDWVICGGESGANARPMHPDWARSLRDQCAAAGVPFFFKQWGEWTPGENVNRVTGSVSVAWHHDEWRFGTENLASTDGLRDDEPDLYRVGKKSAGRLLDGREWREMPDA